MGRERVEAELADFAPSAVTVRVVQAALGAIPSSHPIPWYGTLEQAAELVFSGIPAHITARAVSLLDELDVEQALAVTRAIDALERDRAGTAPSQLLAPAGPDSAPHHRADAALKAHALAFLFARLLPGDTHRQRLDGFDTIPAAQQLLQYFGAVDVAVPFAEDVRNADGTFVAALLGIESAALTGQLVELLGREGLDSAKDMLQDLLPHLDSAVIKVLKHTPSLTTQVRGILPGQHGGTAGEAGALQAYRWLGARLVMESALASAKLELAPTSMGSSTRIAAPDITALLPNPFATPAPAAAPSPPAPPSQEPPPLPAPPPVPADPPAATAMDTTASSAPPADEPLPGPSPFVPTFEPAPQRVAEPAPAPEVFDLLPAADAAEAQPATELGPNPFESVAAVEASEPNPFEHVDAARDALEQMAPADLISNGAGAMMLADAALDPGHPLHGDTEAIDDAAEAAVDLITALTAGTTEWPTEPPPEHPENPFVADPDDRAGAPDNPFDEASAAAPVQISPVDPFAIAGSDDEPSRPAASPPTVEPAPVAGQAQPINPFALDAIEEPVVTATPAPAPVAAPLESLPPPAAPDVPVGIVTASVAASFPGEPQPTPMEAESPTLIPMPTGAARREVEAAVAEAGSDDPPAPPPTVTPTWPTTELSEEERLRGAYLSTDGKWRIFSKEGIVTTAPPATVAPVDWDAHWEAGHTIALYKRRGNHATIEHFDAVPESFTVEREPYSLKINGQTWRRADYDLSDRTMRGQWAAQDGTELILDHEGRISLGSRHGRYRLGAGRVDVTWDGGDAWVASFLSTLAPSSRHPQILWLAGVQYTLRA